MYNAIHLSNSVEVIALVTYPRSSVPEKESLRSSPSKYASYYIFQYG